MNWPRRLSILWNIIYNGFGVTWILCAAGIAGAVLLHRKDKGRFVWPALCALALWLACEVASVNLQSYLGEFLILLIGCLAFAYAAGWLAADLVYLLSGKGKQAGKTLIRRSTGIPAIVMLLLAGTLFVVSLTGAGRAKRLSGLENISSLPIDGAFVQGGKQYLLYGNVYGWNFDNLLEKLNVSSSDQIGKVVAYRFTPNGSACYYYCTVDALPGDWLLMFEDDGSGVPGAENAVYLFGTQESIDAAPKVIGR